MMRDGNNPKIAASASRLCLNSTDHEQRKKMQILNKTSLGEKWIFLLPCNFRDYSFHQKNREGNKKKGCRWNYYGGDSCFTALLWHRYSCISYINPTDEIAKCQTCSWCDCNALYLRCASTDVGKDSSNLLMIDMMRKINHTQNFHPSRSTKRKFIPIGEKLKEIVNFL
jgi:hypothetical protein